MATKHLLQNLSKHVLGRKSLPYVWCAMSTAPGHASHTFDCSHQEWRGPYVDKGCTSRQCAFYRSVCHLHPERASVNAVMVVEPCLVAYACFCVCRWVLLCECILYMYVSVWIHCGKKGECMVGNWWFFVHYSFPDLSFVLKTPGERVCAFIQRWYFCSKKYACINYMHYIQCSAGRVEDK